MTPEEYLKLSGWTYRQWYGDQETLAGWDRPGELKRQAMNEGGYSPPAFTLKEALATQLDRDAAIRDFVDQHRPRGGSND